MTIDRMRNPRLVIFAFCEKIIEDVARKFSLINIFENVHVTDLPRDFSCGMFISIYFEPGEYLVELKSFSPSGELFEQMFEKTLKIDTAVTHSLIINLNIGLEESGTYVFQVFINKSIVGEREIAVVLEKPSSTKEN
jgi:hypothetical protein